MKYRHLFFDLDHTLWDFDANSRQTLLQLYEELQLAQRGVDDFDRFHKNYLVHNERLWDRYRKGFIRQDELRVKRMWLTLLDFKIGDEALSKKLSEDFLELLPTRTLLFPNTIEVLTYLREKRYQLHLITNGFEKVQHGKLASSGLTHFFKEVITSEGSGSLKPNKEIFDYALQRTGASISESLMIGDSWEADVAGALAVGMHAVHANFMAAPQPTKPTYSISSLKELMEIL